MRFIIRSLAAVFIIVVGAFWAPQIVIAQPSSSSSSLSPSPSSSPSSAAGRLSQTEALAPPQGNRPLIVKAAFHLEDINSIDDESENFEFTATLVLTWRDERQSFDPKVEKVSEKVFLGSFQFNEISPSWYPQAILVNQSQLFEKHGTMLRVKPDGTSTLIETINAVAEVDLDMRTYPFDSHKLEAVFEIFGSDDSDVVLEIDPTENYQDLKRIQISQWSLVGVEASIRKRNAPYTGGSGLTSSYVVSFDVKRQSLFTLRLIVIPLAVIVALSWSVFWMERSSLGDRINVSFIGILTAVAYQIVVSDILPHISYLTLMNGFVNVSFLVMSASVVINLVVGAYDKKGKSEIGDRIDYRCRWIFPLVYFGSLLILFSVAMIL